MSKIHNKALFAFALMLSALVATNAMADRKLCEAFVAHINSGEGRADRLKWQIPLLPMFTLANFNDAMSTCDIKDKKYGNRLMCIVNRDLDGELSATCL